MSKALIAISTLILAAAIIVSVVFLLRPVTKVTGIRLSANPSAEQAYSQTIKITPARSRSVKVQQYNAKDKKWVTRSTIRIGAGDTEKVKITFPSEWKNSTYSTWRIFVPASVKGTAYTGKAIRFTVYNRAKIKNLIAKRAVIMRMDNKKVLYDKNMNQRCNNASTTKMLTAAVSMENADGNKVVTISKAAANTEDGCLWLKKKDKFYLKDLWTAMLLASANDAAAAVAEGTAGTQAAFMKMVNQKAKELGCRNTHFVNPHGLDTYGHYSSAYDLALINIEAMKNEPFRKIVLKKKYRFNSLKKDRENFVKSTNELILENYKGHLGGKTGTTDLGGLCFSGVYQYKGVKYVTVVLGSSSRWSDTKKLFHYIRKYG